MTLSTLDKQKSVRVFYFKKRVKPYLILVLLCLLFSFVYSLFSHGVTSPYMSYLFLYPLVLGLLPGAVCMKLKNSMPHHFFATHFYHTGVAALLLSSMLRGIFEIAGTASVYQTVLFFIGVLAILCGAVCFILKK